MTLLGEIRERGGAFVTATDTNVGKTVVAAALVRALDADYWKPIQAGQVDGGDAATVRQLVHPMPGRIHKSAYELKRPRSPHEAAHHDGVRIDLEEFVLPESKRPLIVEGAGGLLVPLNDHDLVVDLIECLALPILLVCRSGLGTINHTLLSLEAIRTRALPLLGVVMNGPTDPANLKAVRKYGDPPLLHALPWMAPMNAAACDVLAATLTDTTAPVTA